jgi:hypothetical protein
MCRLHNQQELEHAVSLVDSNDRMHSLRLRLVREAETLPPGRLGELFGGTPTVSLLSVIHAPLNAADYWLVKAVCMKRSLAHFLK